MWDHLFTTVNDVGVKATYKKTALGTVDMSRLGAEWGICAGMSAVWLKNMFKTRDLATAPDKAAASILYAKWANRQDAKGLSSDEFNRSLVENAGLRVENVRSMGAGSAVVAMSGTAGSYYISTGNHAMAAVTGGGGYYFFDPNGGAWKTGSASEFDGVKGHIESYSGSPGYNANWSILKVTNGS